MKDGMCPKCNSSNAFKKKGMLIGNGVTTVNTGFAACLVEGEK